MEKIKLLLESLANAGVTTTATVVDAAPDWRIARRQISAGYGEWVDSDTVYVYAGRPVAVVDMEDDKDAGWAHVFSPSFRDGEARAARGSYSKCLRIEFSAAEAQAAGVIFE
jgi:hypothetical protein